MTGTSGLEEADAILVMVVDFVPDFRVVSDSLVPFPADLGDILLDFASLLPGLRTDWYLWGLSRWAGRALEIRACGAVEGIRDSTASISSWRHKKADWVLLDKRFGG